MTQKTNKIISLTLALLVTVSLLLSLSACGKDAAPTSESKKVSVTVEIVDDKGEKTTLNLETEKATLADALVEKGVVEYNSGGLYTVINGITADYNQDGAWWCITKDGTIVNEGMNTLKLEDGDKFEITYTK